jgi:uncharacterized damage-inducible protein DinB
VNSKEASVKNPDRAWPSLMGDAFGHHLWASLRLIDACLELSPEQLATVVPGTYGSILSTARHFVGGDAFYLAGIKGNPSLLLDEDRLGLPELRAAMARQADLWLRILADDPDPETIVEEVEEGYRRQAPIGFRLAQAIYHGTDHRSQICTGLTLLGIEPPGIEVWDYGLATGRSTESWPFP